MLSKKHWLTHAVCITNNNGLVLNCQMLVQVLWGGSDQTNTIPRCLVFMNTRTLQKEYKLLSTINSPVYSWVG